MKDVVSTTGVSGVSTGCTLEMLEGAMEVGIHNILECSFDQECLDFLVAE